MKPFPEIIIDNPQLAGMVGSHPHALMVRLQSLANPAHNAAMEVKHKKLSGNPVHTERALGALP